MTAKVIKIIIGDQSILLDRKDLKGVDLSNLRISSNGYAMLGKELLHRVILQPPEDMKVDHRNKNPLDCRRQNLRICTTSENAMNRGKTRDNSTGYKGVNLDKRRKRKKYRARITANGKTYFLGSYKKPDEAGAAYREGAKKHHGQFARICDP